jgi:hypothetical protein
MFSPPPLPRNVEAAFRDLSSAKPDIRRSAISDVVRHAQDTVSLRDRAVSALSIALKDAHAEVRSTAALALADLGDADGLPALLVAMEDDDPYVREMAVAALGEIGDVRAKSRIERALSDRRPELRYQAIIAYCRLADEDSEPSELAVALGRALTDDDGKVRYIALRLAEERWRRLGPRLVDKVLPCFEDSDVEVAFAAALCLVRPQPSTNNGAGADADAARARALEALRAVVRGGKWRGQRLAAEDEGEALELAGALGLQELVPDLERRAYGLRAWVSREFAFRARIGLARLGHARASSDIFRDLDAEREATRDAAIVAAGRARMVGAKPKLLALRGRGSDALIDEALGLLRSEEQAP